MHRHKTSCLEGSKLDWRVELHLAGLTLVTWELRSKPLSLPNLDLPNLDLPNLDDLFAGRVRTRYSTVGALEEECFSADIVVGAVLIAGAAAPKLVTREMMSGMKKGSELVDVAIDQGGCFETSHATTQAEPTYEGDGVIHYRVANMQSRPCHFAISCLASSHVSLWVNIVDRPENF